MSIIIPKFCPAYLPVLHFPLPASPNISESHHYVLIFNHTPQSTKDRTSLLTVCFCSMAVLYCHLLYSTEKLKSSFQIKGLFSSQQLCYLGDGLMQQSQHALCAITKQRMQDEYLEEYFMFTCAQVLWPCF